MCLFLLPICILGLACNQTEIPQDSLEESSKLAKEISVLDWSQVEESFDRISSGSHIRTSNSSWLKNGETIASHTASYQINPSAEGQKIHLLHSDSSAIDNQFEWPENRAALRWIDKNPYQEIRLDSSVFKSPRVVEKYIFRKAVGDQGAASHVIEGRQEEDVIFDEIEIASQSDRIHSIKYVRVQDGFLFKEVSKVEIKLDNDMNSAIPVSWSIDSEVNPILLDKMHIVTQVSYKVLSDPHDKNQP